MGTVGDAYDDAMAESFFASPLTRTAWPKTVDMTHRERGKKTATKRKTAVELTLDALVVIAVEALQFLWFDISSPTRLCRQGVVTGTLPGLSPWQTMQTITLPSFGRGARVVSDSGHQMNMGNLIHMQ